MSSIGTGLVFSPLTYWGLSGELGKRTKRVIRRRLYHDEGIIYPAYVLVCIGDCRMFDEEVSGRIRPVGLVGHHLLHAQHSGRRVYA